MKVIRLNNLTLDNFKGVTHYELQLDGQSADVFGDNASGKTTLYDALTWVLFGKDSKGASKFDVKPLNADGTVRRGAMPTVQAELEVDGDVVIFRKILREKWEKHRGGEERYAGNTVDHFINGVPVQQKRYQQAVSELVDENAFRMLTSVTQFLQDINWKERRETLFDAAGIVSDDTLLAEPGFDGLRDEMNGLSVDDFKAKLLRERKEANRNVNLLPARIDECEKQMNDLPGTFDPEERDRCIRSIAEHQQRIAELDLTDGMTSLDNSIRDVRNSLRELELSNQAHRQSQVIPVTDERPILQERIRSLKTQMDAARSAITSAEMTMMRCNQSIEESRRLWKKINAEKFQTGICHACGQPLPPERNAAMKVEFEQNKNDRLDALVAQSQRDKQTVADCKQSKEQAEQLISEQEPVLRKLQQELQNLSAPPAQDILDLPDYEQCRSELMRTLEDLTEQKQMAQNDQSVARQSIMRTIAELQSRKTEEDAKEAAYQQKKRLAARITDLEQEQRVISARVERIDELLEMVEDFTRMKVAKTSELVNNLFAFVSFRLFTENINGGLQDCCDAMVDGVPYDSLNSAMKINAGLDCIRVLSEHAGVRVPLFIDNAESVTAIADIGTQTIRLYVREDTDTEKGLRYYTWH